MKFDKETAFVEVFEFPSEGLKELSIEAIRKAVTPLKNPRYIPLEIREYVTNIEFDEKGFKGLDKEPAEEIVKSCRDLQEIFRKTFMNVTIIKCEGNDVLVAPNYIINIKDNKIYNIFDTIDRMKRYDFLADMINKGRDAWKIVTARNKCYTIPLDKFEKMYPWVNDVENKSRKPENVGIKITDTSTYDWFKDEQGLPIEKVNELLQAHKVSLLGTDESLISLSEKLKSGKITEEDIINKRF